MKGSGANPTAAMLVIGDEILSGRTRDSNAHYLAGRLAQAGIDLCEVRMIGDDAAAIGAAVRALAGRYSHVFTSGGIGPTHDDITADAIGAAFGARVAVREDARALLAARYERMGVEFNEARQRMARIPEGAALIDNPVSTAPGFSLGNVHVMAGVPEVFRAMLDGLLPRLAGGAAALSESLRVELPEGDIAGPLAALAARHAGVSIGSYPFFEGGTYGANIVVRGSDAQAVAAALADLRETFGALP